MHVEQLFQDQSRPPKRAPKASPAEEALAAIRKAAAFCRGKQGSDRVARKARAALDRIERERQDQS